MITWRVRMLRVHTGSWLLDGASAPPPRAFRALMLDSLYEIKASGEETNGAMTVMEMTIPEGMGPPPHIHPGTETIYVVEGTLRLHIGDEVFDGGPGSLFHIPEGTLERFQPTSTVRLVVIYTPGPGQILRRGW
ncbi:cupin domain-containing protein [Streptomyces sp. 8N616]|uniref:cupin domain-containing protein n=1 Tax=Streptomyces sp. 8N616 TaxID=3457414 RepID=UPI003FD62E74